MKRLCTILLLLVAVAAPQAWGQYHREKPVNRPYADQRRWHLGFGVGMQAMDLSLTHNGIATADGQTWYCDQPGVSPGFTVQGLFDVRLGQYFSLRLTPGMVFGSRDLKFIDTTGGQESFTQSVKTTFVVLPIDIKYNALRYRNMRPYVLAGVMPAFDVSKRRRDPINLKSMDMMLSVGFGCDIYLPFFKLAPEVKFCIGLSDVLDHKRADLSGDPDMIKYTQSLKKATTKMVVFTFYFE